MLDVLRFREFRLLISARFASQLGNQATTVALGFAVLALTGRAGDVGVVLAVEGFAIGGFLLLGGMLGDRLARRRLMIGADLVRLVSQGTMAVLLLSGVAQVWHLVVLQIVSGAASACYIPAVAGIQSETVPAERLRDANALRGLVIAVTGVLGPALGGTLATLIDPAYALGLDALTFAASALLEWRMRTGRKPASTRRSVLHDLREGWTHFSSRRWLWTVTAQSAVVRAFAIAPMAVLGPVIAERFLHGPGTWATTMGAVGVGAMVGGLGVSVLKPTRPLVLVVAGAALFVPLLLALAAKTALIVLIATGFLVGVEQSVYWTFWQTAVQENVPSTVLSRVSSYDWLATYAVGPLGYLVAGGLATVVGAPGALVVSASVLLIGTALVLAVPDIWRMRIATVDQAAASSAPLTRSAASSTSSRGSDVR